MYLLEYASHLLTEWHRIRCLSRSCKPVGGIWVGAPREMISNATGAWARFSKDAELSMRERKGRPLRASAPICAGLKSCELKQVANACEC